MISWSNKTLPQILIIFCIEKTAKSRPNFSKKTTTVLMNWLTEHIHHPWPTKQEKKELCALSGLNAKQLRIWFTNNRKVSLKQRLTDIEKIKCIGKDFQSRFKNCIKWAITNAFKYEHSKLHAFWQHELTCNDAIKRTSIAKYIWDQRWVVKCWDPIPNKRNI